MIWVKGTGMAICSCNINTFMEMHINGCALTKDLDSIAYAPTESYCVFYTTFNHINFIP